MRIDFDSLHSVELLGDRFRIRARKGNDAFDFTFDRTAIALLIPLLQKAALELGKPGEVQVLALGFQPIVARGVLGVEIQLSGELSIPLLLGESGIAALRACMAQLPGEADPSPAPTH